MKPTPHEQMADWLAWFNQAKSAIEQGQSVSYFVAHAHPDNRPIARRAYLRAKLEMNGPPCDRCGQPNPLTWSNMCPSCRDAFNRATDDSRARDAQAAQAAWSRRPE